MKSITEYTKGGNKGAIMDMGTHYTAVTAVESKDFKSINVAKRFMERKGYKKTQQ